MKAIARIPLQDLVESAARTRKPQPSDPVWNLNLDQIEPNTGHILNRVLTDRNKLGPSTYAFEEGTVLYSKLRPYLNKVVVADQDGFATTELVPLLCKKEKLLPQYLAHFLRSPEFVSFASNVVAGAKMPRMVMGEFWAYEIPAPSLDEQRRIVAILDHAVALRAKRREALAQLESLTQSIFTEIFGDPEELIKANTCRALSDVVAPGKIVTYGIVQAGPDIEDGVPYIRTGDIKNGRILEGQLARTSPEIAAAYSRSSISPNDIVMSIRATVGTTALVPPSLDGANLTQGTARISPGETVRALYLLTYLRTESVQAWIQSQVKGATFREITLGKLRELPVFIPPLSLQDRFVERAFAVGILINRAEESLKGIDALFASTQHRAFRGEL